MCAFNDEPDIRTDNKRAYIVCGEGRPDIEHALADRRKGDMLIAADSGANRLLACGYVPDVVIGDMDSVHGEVLERLRSESRLIRHPADKDSADAELALRLAARNGAGEAVLLNDLGGRFDQAMGVVALLFVARELGLSAHIRGSGQRVWLVRDHWRLRVSAGTLVSLLPWSPEVRVTATAGLRWPLRSETLLRAATRGVSNEATQELVTLEIAAGEMLVVVTPREKA